MPSRNKKRFTYSVSQKHGNSSHKYSIMSLESPLNTALDFEAISESTRDTYFPISIDQPRSQVRG